MKGDKIIRKFSLYGFLKNLKFFEPFLYIFFLSLGFSYFQIGILISAREITKNVLEVPSGVYADQRGRKRSLQLCFILYILSFILFYLGNTFWVMIFAMILFGVGEAFRSGTHKAIIFTYLDKNNLSGKKTQVYGKTRSYSLIGSAISAVVGGFVLFINSNYRLVFLISVIPYILDFILISTYPDYLNGVVKGKLKFKDFYESGISSFKNLFSKFGDLRKSIINSGVYDGYFDVLKDYLQPVLKLEIAALPLLLFISDSDKRLSLLLGFSYAIIYLASSYFSHNAFKIKDLFGKTSASLNILYFLTAIIIGFVGFVINSEFTLFVIFLFLIFHVVKNIRRPIMVDYISSVMRERERATMLSIESQFKTLFIIVVAPLIGYFADIWGIQVMFFIVFVSMILMAKLVKLSTIREAKKHKAE